MNLFYMIKFHIFQNLNFLFQFLQLFSRFISIFCHFGLNCLKNQNVSDQNVNGNVNVEARSFILFDLDYNLLDSLFHLYECNFHTHCFVQMVNQMAYQEILQFLVVLFIIFDALVEHSFRQKVIVCFFAFQIHL